MSGPKYNNRSLIASKRLRSRKKKVLRAQQKKEAPPVVSSTSSSSSSTECQEEEEEEWIIQEEKEDLVIILKSPQLSSSMTIGGGGKKMLLSSSAFRLAEVGGGTTSSRANSRSIPCRAQYQGKGRLRYCPKSTYCCSTQLEQSQSSSSLEDSDKNLSVCTFDLSHYHHVVNDDDSDDTYVVYDIQIFIRDGLSKNDNEYVVSKRYSEFIELQSQLRTEAPGWQLPPKTWLSVPSADATFLAGRCQGLAQSLAQLFQRYVDHDIEHEALRSFFQL